jgi:hypothetical protein
VTEFRRVGFAKYDGARIEQSFDGRCTGFRNAILDRERPHGRWHARDIVEVFYRDRHAMEGTQRLSRHDGRLSGPRGFECLVTKHQRVCIDRRILLFDPTQIGLDNLDRRSVSSAYARCEFRGGQEAQVDRIRRAHCILSSSASQLIWPFGSISWRVSRYGDRGLVLAASLDDRG